MTTYASDGTTQTNTIPDVEPTADESSTELEIVDADTLPAISTTPPTTTGWTHPDGWTHDWLDFHGDKLAIRIPKGAALVALEFSRFRGEEAQEQAFGTFVARHVSDATFDRILDRMGNPDDEDYTTTTLGELAGLLGKIAGERLQKDAQALAEVKNGHVRKDDS